MKTTLTAVAHLDTDRLSRWDVKAPPYLYKELFVDTQFRNTLEIFLVSSSPQLIVAVPLAPLMGTRIRDPARTTVAPPTNSRR